MHFVLVCFSANLVVPAIDHSISNVTEFANVIAIAIVIPIEAFSNVFVSLYDFHSNNVAIAYGFVATDFDVDDCANQILIDFCNVVDDENHYATDSLSVDDYHHDKNHMDHCEEHDFDRQMF